MQIGSGRLLLACAQRRSTLLALGLDGKLKHEAGVAASAAHGNLTLVGSCYRTDYGPAEAAAADVARPRWIGAEEGVARLRAAVQAEVDRR